MGYTVYPTMESRHVFTVSELNTTARTALEQGVGPVWVQGEVSDLTRAPSGHIYFTLKDEGSQLSAVRFKSRTSLLAPVTIEPGTVVLAQGTLTVYEPRGRYQFIVSILQPIGAGAIQRAFERLKRKLQEEGLFSPEAKSELPTIPNAIGVITSSKGAALRDVHSVLKRRWPHVRIFLFPSTVQGDTAPKELREALDRAIRFSQSNHVLDVLILTRGGGSAEDLAAFNDESLARDLYACPIPTISAVGHEIDFSITDFVADRRAPTPSAAAEVAVPDRTEALGLVNERLYRILRQTRAVWKERLDEFRLRADACLMRSPQRRFDTYEQRLDLGLAEVLRNMSSLWKAQHAASNHWAEILRLSDPSLPLQRGYSLTFRPGDSRPIRSISDLAIGDSIETRLTDGRLVSDIQEVSSHES
ncbi:exodeoxyribonuclease VII large subunit [Candidatus Bipolaricaulota bacterium]|nr:exodeoxyribonuclease VII large subunit [Candidatus Bipolaricaulota bacterium]